MSFDDDSASSFVPEDDSAGSGGWSDRAAASPKAAVHVSAPMASYGSSANSLTGWRRLLKQESQGCKVDVKGKSTACEVVFDLHHSAPAGILAVVTMDIHMMFGSSLQSKLRGIWDDSNFTIQFHIVSNRESPLGIAIGANRSFGYDTAPVAFTVAGSRRISPCLQEGAISAIILRMLNAAFSSWHSSHFYTAQECRALTPVSQKEALQILEQVLDRPCRTHSLDATTGYVITCGEEGYLPISDGELNDPSLDYHVRITVHNGCIVAIDIEGAPLNPERERALEAARDRLGLKVRPMPITRHCAATILELIIQPLVPKDVEATPNLFLYIAAHVALSLKNSLAYANSHTGEELPRPNVMPFVPPNELSLHAIDEGICGLSLQDALCCIPHDVITMVFKSALAASDHQVHGRGSGASSHDLCQPWPSFLLNEIVLNADRAGIIGDAARRAKTDAKCSEGQAAGTNHTTFNAGRGTQNKKVGEWKSSLSSALRALQDPALLAAMSQARLGNPSSTQRQQVLQQFLSCCTDSATDALPKQADDQKDMILRVCGFVLRTLPYLPVQVQDNLLWFGEATPWEDGLVEDVSLRRFWRHTIFHY
jgi:hypothetical protein